MADDTGVVRRVAWKQLCPWLMIFRIFRISISLPVLVMAVVGVLLTPLGWWLASTTFITDVDLREPGFREYVDSKSHWPLVLEARLPSAPDSLEALHQFKPWRPGDSHVVAVYRHFLDPFSRLLDRRASLTQAAYLLFGGLWNIAVWAFFGGTITRIAAVKLGRDERLGLGAAMRHVTKNYFWYVLSPLFPLLGLLFASLPALALGALMRADVGVIVAGVLWPLVLIAGLVMVIFMIGVMFGWPLMFPTISSEAGSDAFEAFSRSFSYTFQRPLHYLFYATVTMVFGGVCWLAVSLAADQIVELSLWAASWGGGTARISDVVAGAGGSTVAENGGWLIRASNGITVVVVLAFGFAFFWCGATAIYLLLRRDADQMDIDEVFLDDEAGRYGLPPLKPVEASKPEGKAATSPATASEASTPDVATPDIALPAGSASPVAPGETPDADSE